jgi:hypothetical protein
VNPDEPQPRDPAGGDSLDRLLAGARWPEPTVESEQRLRTFWAGVSPARETAPLLRFPLRRLAAAAAVLIVAGGVVWFVVSRQHRPAQQQIVTPVAPSADPGRSPAASPRPEPLTPRPPTNREKLVMAGAAAHYRANERRTRLVGRVDDAVAAIAADSSVDPAALLAALTRPSATLPPAPPVPPELLVGRLAGLARTGEPALRPAAARLLAGLRLRSTLPVFIELARQPETKAVAYEQVIAMADDATLAQVAQEEADAESRHRLLAALVGRGRPQATVAYLRQVADARTSASALEALDEVHHPPVDALVTQLGNTDARIRFAAAKALGRINGPDVTARMAALVERDVHRREALAALIYSRGKEAARYLDTARKYPELAAAIDSVQVQTSRSF